MATNNFATAKEVATALNSVGFRTSNEVLTVISRNCREEFLNHLALCVTGQDTDGASNKFIANLLHCLSPNVVNRIRDLFPDASIDAIVPVAIAVPTRFLSAIDAAHDPTHARHADAKNYLAAIFPAPVAQQEPCQPASEPPRSTTSNTPTNKSESSGEKKYYSVHVYGSNAALCFNATHRDGAPGVMVDAALQTGPKSYDWKNAVHVWLDVNEVGSVLAVFRRWRPGVEFSAHGAQNDKGFSIEFQKPHFFAKVFSRKADTGSVRAVKVMPTDATAVSILFLSQLAACYPSIPLNELLATVRATQHVENAAGT